MLIVALFVIKLSLKLGQSKNLSCCSPSHTPIGHIFCMVTFPPLKAFKNMLPHSRFVLFRIEPTPAFASWVLPSATNHKQRGIQNKYQALTNTNHNFHLGRSRRIRWKFLIWKRSGSKKGKERNILNVHAVRQRIRRTKKHRNNICKITPRKRRAIRFSSK